MQQVVSSAALTPSGRWLRITSRARLEAPTLTEWVLAAISVGLLILSFPNFESYLLAWISLVPLLVAIARRPSPGSALILGWATGTVFFFVTCYWLTYSMIHYGGLPTVLAYLLLLPGALVVGIFPALFAALVALVIRQWGQRAMLLAPILWAALEWVRLGVTGQLWNALGYSQAYNPLLIQGAAWGGVYAISFLIVAVNSMVALLILKRTRWTIAGAALMALLVVFVFFDAIPLWDIGGDFMSERRHVNVVAVQPNVPMNPIKSVEETKELLERHLSLSTKALDTFRDNSRRLVIWPESPMNFTYASDKSFQELVARFTRENHTSLLLNSLEPAPGNGAYNSALLINEEGRLISQYDKIRLMPFGEYIPLPQWLPGASLITGIVGDFTPGDKYTVMPFGEHQAGVFICIESAYPWIARRLTNEGADVLINISNDGYLGPTAVMRQHLANAIFRAVENGRPILRVTNTGLTAWIDKRGRIQDRTEAFEADVRVWSIAPNATQTTFYTRHGDLFVQICAAFTLLVIGALLVSWRRSIKDLR
jgi:apolipoprotein N-acyltransferase